MLEIMDDEAASSVFSLSPKLKLRALAKSICQKPIQSFAPFLLGIYRRKTTIAIKRFWENCSFVLFDDSKRDLLYLNVFLRHKSSGSSIANRWNRSHRSKVK